jgi:hypothetical protein
MARTLLTVVAVQVGWAACVVGAASGRGWLGPAVVGVLLVVRIATQPHRPGFIRTVLGALAIGATLDGLLAAAGVLVFPDATTSTWPPAWMVALWGNFALALDALQWLANRPALASAVGAVGGPLAYLAGARLGAVALGPTEAAALVAIALEWAVALPLLLFLSGRPDPSADTNGQGVARGIAP